MTGRESKRSTEWCCLGFRGHVDVAGQRGAGIFTHQNGDGSWQFILQFRALDPGEALPATECRVSKVTEVVIAYCPWCGAVLASIYRMPERFKGPDLRTQLG